MIGARHSLFSTSPCKGEVGRVAAWWGSTRAAQVMLWNLTTPSLTLPLSGGGNRARSNDVVSGGVDR